NALSDTTIVRETGPFFLAVFSDQIYWTDAGLNLQNIEVHDAETQLTFNSTVDVGYQLQTPPAPSDNLVFSYLYVLPYYLKAVGMTISVGASLFADFGKNSDREQDALLSFADFLSRIHNKIANEGIKQLTPGLRDRGWAASISFEARAFKGHVDAHFVPG